MAPKKKGPPKSLAAGRPPVLHRVKSKSISRTATKALINKHHLLHKKKRQALVKGDQTAEAAIDAEIEALGGIESYQEASLQGQRHDRGGDSSRVLMQWLEPCLSPSSQDADSDAGRKLRMLEVGALSTQNACSKSGHFDIERIDLNSQGEGILQQDFMERPLPKDESERFDIISLSLVLNYVPEPKGRGEMLRRTAQFLRAPGRYIDSPQRAANFPSLFLVLPAPCVTNSRYLDEEKLVAIMESLGYVKTASKTTQRLVYYLWRRDRGLEGTRCSFQKKEIRSGSTRNNFAVVLG
jgi:25S rRNA (adenine2142-N1)-methyltransferase